MKIKVKPASEVQIEARKVGEELLAEDLYLGHFEVVSTKWAVIDTENMSTVCLLLLGWNRVYDVRVRATIMLGYTDAHDVTVHSNGRLEVGDGYKLKRESMMGRFVESLAEAVGGDYAEVWHKLTTDLDWLKRTILHMFQRKVVRASGRTPKYILVRRVQ